MCTKGGISIKSIQNRQKFSKLVITALFLTLLIQILGSKAGTDTLPPTVEFIPPSPPNNSYLSQTEIILNISHIEENPETLILNWNSVEEFYTYSNNISTITKSSLPEGTYSRRSTYNGYLLSGTNR